MDATVTELLGAVASPVRRRDAEALIELMRRVTGEEPAVWAGRIIGFGTYHYRYDGGREGDAPAAAFAPRGAATTVYLLDGVARYAEELAALGPHTTGVGCLYLKRLDAVDGAVLERVVAASYRRLTSGDIGSCAGDATPGGS